MNIVIDSNVLFSALVKDALTRKIILEYDSNFLFPMHIFIELERNKEEIFTKSKMTKENFDNLLQIIFEKVKIIPTEALESHLKEAWDLIKDHSPEDVMFIACALAFEGSILWSDDKKLKIQKKVKVLNTNEIKEIFI